MREEFQDEYADLDQACEELTESETQVGVLRTGHSEDLKPAQLNYAGSRRPQLLLGATECAARISLRLGAAKQGALWACPE
jgi:hypothetical protein